MEWLWWILWQVRPVIRKLYGLHYVRCFWVLIHWSVKQYSVIITPLQQKNMIILSKPSLFFACAVFHVWLSNSETKHCSILVLAHKAWLMLLSNIIDQHWFRTTSHMRQREPCLSEHQWLQTIMRLLLSWGKNGQRQIRTHEPTVLTSKATKKSRIAQNDTSHQSILGSIWEACKILAFNEVTTTKAPHNSPRTLTPYTTNPFRQTFAPSNSQAKNVTAWVPGLQQATYSSARFHIGCYTFPVGNNIASKPPNMNFWNCGTARPKLHMYSSTGKMIKEPSILKQRPESYLAFSCQVSGGI